MSAARRAGTAPTATEPRRRRRRDARPARDRSERRFSVRLRIALTVAFALVGGFLLLGLGRSFGAGDAQVVVFTLVLLAMFGQVGWVVLRAVWGPAARASGA